MLVAAALLAIGALAGGTAWRHGRHRRDRSKQLARALDDSQRAHASQDDAARAAALLQALEIVSADSGSKIDEELASLRAHLEAVRFGGSHGVATESIWRDAEAMINRRS